MAIKTAPILPIDSVSQRGSSYFSSKQSDDDNAIDCQPANCTEEQGATAGYNYDHLPVPTDPLRAKRQLQKFVGEIDTTLAAMTVAVSHAGKHQESSLAKLTQLDEHMEYLKGALVVVAKNFTDVMNNRLDELNKTKRVLGWGVDVANSLMMDDEYDSEEGMSVTALEEEKSTVEAEDVASTPRLKRELTEEDGFVVEKKPRKDDLIHFKQTPVVKWDRNAARKDFEAKLLRARNTAIEI